MQKLFLHCGVHRTGTTQIQTYLTHNRAFFADLGLVYPFDQENHQFIVTWIKDQKIPMEDLIARLKNVPAPEGAALLLSAEDFCAIGHADWLRPLASNFDVSIIFYLRRQDIWMNSWYNQNIKWPWDVETCSLSPEEFLCHIDEFYWIDYRKILDSWAAVVGKSAIMLGVVEEQQVFDVFPDFLAKVGLADVAVPDRSSAVRNDSVSPFTIEVLRHLNHLALPPDARWEVVQRISEIAESLYPRQNKMVFTPQERRMILQRFAGSNAEVAKDYFGREDGRLFFQPDVSDHDEFTRVTLPPGDQLLRKVVAPLLKSCLAGVRR